MTTSRRPEQLQLARDGAQWLPGAAQDLLALMEATLAGSEAASAPGIRLSPKAVRSLGTIVQDAVNPLSSSLEGKVAVRAVLFDKAERANWVLGRHQDRTINVARRLEVAGFGPWTIKSGAHYVEPPFTVMEGMMTVRVHLDHTPLDNAPLLIAVGSHRLGKVAAVDATRLAAGSEQVACIAERGDVWLYATPILHASDRSSRSARRVLQLDYAPPFAIRPLSWAVET